MSRNCAVVVLIGCCGLLGVFSTGSAADGDDRLTPREARTLGEVVYATSGSGPLEICPGDSGAPDGYALCAAATCWTMDNVAYCKCELEHGESISLPFNYVEEGEAKDVCDTLAAGVGNGFTVSTYSTPPRVLKRYARIWSRNPSLPRPQALYTCPPPPNSSPLGDSAGAGVRNSAQCDGGICFTSTSGSSFPGLGAVAGDQIVCACPIATIAAGQNVGFQFTGPWNCEHGERNEEGRCCDAAWYDEYCVRTGNTARTGAKIAVGAPSGTPLVLSKKLDGKIPRVNRCDPPSPPNGD